MADLDPPPSHALGPRVESRHHCWGVLDDRHCHCTVPARPAAAGAGRGLHRQGRVRPGPAFRGQPIHCRAAAARGGHLVAGAGSQRARAGGGPARTGAGQCGRQQHHQPGPDPGRGGHGCAPAAARAPADGAVVVAAGGGCAADPVRA